MQGRGTSGAVSAAAAASGVEDEQQGDGVPFVQFGGGPVLEGERPGEGGGENFSGVERGDGGGRGVGGACGGAATGEIDEGIGGRAGCAGSGRRRRARV
jgi:hypothetical protein